MIDLVGYFAGALTLIGYLPQTIKTIRSRKTRDLSLPTFIIIGGSAVLWTIYGLANAKPAIWATNSVVSVCSVIIISLKLTNK